MIQFCVYRLELIMKFKSFALITGIAVSEFVFTAAFSSAGAIAQVHDGSIIFTPNPNGNMVTQSFTGSFKFKSEKFNYGPEPEWFEVTELSVKTPLAPDITYTLGQLVSADKLLFDPSGKQFGGYTANRPASLDSAVFSPIGARPYLEFFPRSSNIYKTSTLAPLEDDSNIQSGQYVAVKLPEPLTILGAATATGFGAFFKHKRKLSESSEEDNTKDS
jgi:hypothetical protein